MSFIVPAYMVPPEEWLISSRGEIESDMVVHREWVADYLDEAPFPGVAANKDEWWKQLNTVHEQALRDTDYSSECPSAREVASETLFKHAPETIHLQVHFSKNDLKRVHGVDEAAFLEGFKVFGRSDYMGTVSWEAYRAWLLQQDGTTVEFGSIECVKTDDILNKIKQFGTLSGFRLWWGRQQDIVSSHPVYGIMKKLGENLYMADDNNRTIVKIYTALVAPSLTYIDNADFADHLEALQESFKQEGNPKCLILIDKAEAQQKSPMTSENTHVLWLPAGFDEKRERVRGHFLRGDGESLQIQKRISTGNTDSGDLTLCIFRAELSYIKGRHGPRRSISDKFCMALGLTMAATEYMYWANDNEDPEKLRELVTELATYWRITLLKKTDQELGIGIGETVAEGEMSASRKALYELLNVRGKRFEQLVTCHDGKGALKFNWKPGKSRKRKTPSPTSVAAQATFSFDEGH